MLQIIIGYFNKGLYNEKDVYNFVLSGQITEEEYNIITNLTDNKELNDILLQEDFENELY